MTAAPAALTDFALACEAALFAGLIDPRRRLGRPKPDRAKSARATLVRWFELFFFAIAAASMIGGAVHGFAPDQSTVAGRVLWTATMIAVGAAALGAWGIGATIGHTLGLSARLAQIVIWTAIAEFVLFARAIILGARSFRLAIIDYLPAVLFLLAVFAIGCLRRRDPGYLPGALAMAVTILAAAVQQSNAAIATLGLAHNALYHLIQGVALLLLYISARHLTRPRNAGPPA
jgi:hypothetical protein